MLSAALVNSPFDDPRVYVEFKYRKEALLFDLGDISTLPARKILKVKYIFISHTHMDHFIGFDQMLRTCLGRDLHISLFGPPNYLEKIEHKLQSYTWNLVENYTNDFEITATEVHSSYHLRRRYRCRNAFRVEGSERREGGTLLIQDDLFSIHGILLDHAIPCLAFRFEENQRINIKKNVILEMGLLGDYIDRGPDSKGVLDTIMNLYCRVAALMGNHEEMWLRAAVAREDPVVWDININAWMENGGREALRSFSGTDTRPYLEFISDLPLFLELDDFYLVHAEFDFSLSDPFGMAGMPSMLWGRGKPYHGTKPVICGHTPLPLEQVKEGLKTNKIDIDNGCCYSNRIGQNNLLAYGLDDGRLYIQKNIEE